MIRTDIKSWMIRKMIANSRYENCRVPRLIKTLERHFPDMSWYVIIFRKTGSSYQFREFFAGGGKKSGSRGSHLRWVEVSNHPVILVFRVKTCACGIFTPQILQTGLRKLTRESRRCGADSWVYIKSGLSQPPSWACFFSRPRSPLGNEPVYGTSHQFLP